MNCMFGTMEWCCALPSGHAGDHSSEPPQPPAPEEPLCIINSEAMDKETVEIVTSWQPPATGLVRYSVEAESNIGWSVEWAAVRHVDPQGEYYLAADVEAWMESKLLPRQYSHTAYNGVIDDLLAQLRGGGA